MARFAIVANATRVASVTFSWTPRTFTITPFKFTKSFDETCILVPLEAAANREGDSQKFRSETRCPPPPNRERASQIISYDTMKIKLIKLLSGDKLVFI